MSLHHQKIRKVQLKIYIGGGVGIVPQMFNPRTKEREENVVKQHN